MASDLIPNSFQTPNGYVDEFMFWLTPPEWKVLTYTVRRIFGFQKRQDRISLSQYIVGTISTQDGRHLDHGTGLSKPAVIAALDNLIRYGLIIKLADNNVHRNEGALYALQLNVDQVDRAGLLERANSASRTNQQRTTEARRKIRTRSVGLTGSSSGEVVSGTDQGRSVGLTGGGQSDRPGPVSGTDTQNQEETQQETQGEIQRAAAGTPRAPSRSKKAKSPSPQKTTATKRDQLLKQPAIAIYRDVTRLAPNAVQAQAITRAIGDDPGQLEVWRAVLTDWQLSGYKPTNVKGQLDRFKKNLKGHSHETSQSTVDTPQPTAEQRAAAERINAARAAKQQRR